MESYAVALLIFCLVGIVLTALYTALSGDSFALHKRFGKIAFELRAQDRAGSSAEPLPPGTARSLVEWAVERLPPPKDSKAVERTVGMLVHAGFKYSDAMPIYRLVRQLAVVLCAILGYVGRPADRRPRPGDDPDNDRVGDARRVRANVLRSLTRPQTFREDCARTVRCT